MGGCISLFFPFFRPRKIEFRAANQPGINVKVGSYETDEEVCLKFNCKSMSLLNFLDFFSCGEIVPHAIAIFRWHILSGQDENWYTFSRLLSIYNTIIWDPRLSWVRLALFSTAITFKLLFRASSVAIFARHLTRKKRVEYVMWVSWVWQRDALRLPQTPSLVDKLNFLIRFRYPGALLPTFYVTAVGPVSSLFNWK